jgi:3-methyladenine DNA glycosylase AlkD
MTAADVLTELKQNGSAQARKTYARHGATGEMYGVSYAVLGKLTKLIKTNHALAKQLWDSGIHDARVLALMVADPAAADERLLEQWGRAATNYVMADAVASFAARTPAARTCATKWMKSDDEFLCAAGWNTAARLVSADGPFADAEVGRMLETIEREIHGAKNRVRHSMNGALITIGLRDKAFEKKAIAAAGRIGKVNVDHGDTDCKTPDAAAYIKKTADHRAATAKKVKSAKTARVAARR